MCVFVCAHRCPLRTEWGVPDPLALEFWAAWWHLTETLGIDLCSPGRTVSAPNHWTITLALESQPFKEFTNFTLG